MNQSVLSGKNGLVAQQQRLDNLANNIANINTYGYKAIRTDFRDMIYQTTKRPVQPQEEANKQRGHGVLAATSTRIFTQGLVEDTGEPLDFCIQGEGLFAVMDTQGDIRYTRDGMFFVSIEPTGNYLVNSHGMYVLNTENERIALPQDGRTVNVDDRGRITLVGGTEETYVGQFGIYVFPNGEGLLSEGSNTYVESEASGAAMAMPASTVLRQGSLEGSNVDLAKEMTYMIRAQRSFQAASRAISTADSMDGVANSMRA